MVGNIYSYGEIILAEAELKMAKLRLDYSKKILKVLNLDNEDTNEGINSAI